MTYEKWELDGLNDVAIHISELISKKPQEHDADQNYKGKDQGVFNQALTFYGSIVFQG